MLDNRFGASHRLIYALQYGQYNISPHKTVRAGVGITYTNLTQPTELGGELGWYGLYQPSNALVGHIRAFCVAEPDYKPRCPTNRR